MPKQGQSSDFNAAMKALAVLIIVLISLADICNSVKLSKARSIIQEECICDKCSEGEGNISNWFQTRLEYYSRAHVDWL